jgi:hypothetical protein
LAAVWTVQTAWIDSVTAMVPLAVAANPTPGATTLSRPAQVKIAALCTWNRIWLAHPSADGGQIPITACEHG